MSPVQQFAQQMGVSADGCRTKADVKDRVEMLRNIGKGWIERKLVNPYRVLS